MVPLVAAASLFFFIFLPGVGLFDYYLAKIGVRGFNWLGDPDVALWSLIGITVWKNAGYYMLFYLAGLQTLPGDVLEAATIDGANGWQRLRHVIVPLLAPTTAFVLVIALINVLTQVDHVIVLTKGGPSNSTKLVLYYIFEQAHENFAAGKAAAASLLSVSFLLAMSLVSLKTMERGAMRRASPIVAGLMLAIGLPLVDAVPVDAGGLVPAAVGGRHRHGVAGAGLSCRPRPTSRTPSRPATSRSTTSTPRSWPSASWRCRSSPSRWPATPSPA